MENEKPPIGIITRWIWLRQIAPYTLNKRLEDIDKAIVRYTIARTRIPIEWITERNELIQALKKSVDENNRS